MNPERRNPGQLWHLLALLAVTGGVTAPTSTSAGPGTAAIGENVRPPASTIARPLAFELNRGQTDDRVKFLARGPGYTLFLTGNEAVLALRTPRREPAAVRMKLAGANLSPHVEGEGELPGKIQYFRETGRQVPSLPTYAAVRYRGVYPGVDLVYHARRGQLEYDFIIAPGADPGVITLVFEGAEELEVDARGDLVLHTAGGELRQPRPVVFQERDDHRTAFSGEYVITGDHEVSLVLEAYDASHPLIIDPPLLYSTYLGGSAGDAGTGIAVDAEGGIYVTGTTISPDFPATPEAHQEAPGGGSDAFVTKLDAAGALIYSTYIGGECDDHSAAIAVDAAGSAYITGRARGGVCLLPDSAGVLVAKLDPTGAGVYFFVFGGSLADTSTGQSIAVDGSGSAYVTGLAGSNSGDFPTTPGVFQREHGSFGADGFVAKVNASGNALVYSTYLGGSDHESANAIAIDEAGNAYVAGSTVSRDFPRRNAFQPTHHGAGPLTTNAFVAKLNSDGSGLVYSTYLGGELDTAAQGIAVDSAGHAYVTGYTISSDFPTTPGVLQPRAGNRLCLGLCSDAFVTKLDPDGSALVYSTYLYGESNDQGVDIALDAAGNAYVAGETASHYFPILGPFQPTIGGLFDGFVAKLNGDGTALVYSSYLGGGNLRGKALEGWDSALGIAVDEAGSAYLTGQTYSFDFPTTQDAMDSMFAGEFCATVTTPCADGFVTRIAADGPVVIPETHITASPRTVPIGGTVTATWAGIPALTSSDRIHLNALGGGGFSFDELSAWSTDGASAGTLALTLPEMLVPGWYELRLLSLDSSSVLAVIARSEPFRVGAVAGGGRPFHRGDSNSDGRLDLSDGIFVLLYLFTGGAVLECREAADANNDGRIDISDGIHLLTFLFLGGAAPAPPGPPGSPCGLDTDPPGSPGDLGCTSFGPCAAPLGG